MMGYKRYKENRMRAGEYASNNKMISAKNRIICQNSGKAKLAWDSKKEVETFLKFNGDSIPEKGEGELRPYYCAACNKWHFTSRRYRAGFDKAAEKRCADLAEAYRPLEGEKYRY